MLLHVLIHSGTPALALKIIRSVEKRLICTYTVVCIYSGVIIKTLSLSEQSLSAEAPGILSTELMIFLFMAEWSQMGLYMQPSKVYLISDIAF